MLEDFSDPELKLIYQELAGGASASSLLGQAADDSTRSRLASILYSPPVQGTDEMIKMARQCLQTIRSANGRARLEKIISEISVCSDPARKQQLMTEWQELDAKINMKKE